MTYKVLFWLQIFFNAFSIFWINHNQQLKKSNLTSRILESSSADPMNLFWLFLNMTLGSPGASRVRSIVRTPLNPRKRTYNLVFHSCIHLGVVNVLDSRREQSSIRASQPILSLVTYSFFPLHRRKCTTLSSQHGLKAILVFTVISPSTLTTSSYNIWIDSPLSHVERYCWLQMSMIQKSGKKCYPDAMSTSWRVLWKKSSRRKTRKTDKAKFDHSLTKWEGKMRGNWSPSFSSRRFF